MIQNLVTEKSNRIKLYDSNYHSFSKMAIFDEELKYLICIKCNELLKIGPKISNVIDQHKNVWECEYLMFERKFATKISEKRFVTKICNKHM